MQNHVQGMTSEVISFYSLIKRKVNRLNNYQSVRIRNCLIVQDA